MIDGLLDHMSLFSPLGSRQRATLAAAVIATPSFAAGQKLLRSADKPTSVQFLLSGTACRYSLLPNGQCQITALLLPGDPIGFESLVQRSCVDTVSALTLTQSAQIPARVIATWLACRSPVSEMLWRITQLQTAITREWVVNVGKRPALERMAHFFCETVTRSRALGISTASGCNLPLTQAELATIVAITPVHVNRVLMQLKRENLVSLSRGYLRILDLPALQALAGFDPAYLAPLHPTERQEHDFQTLQHSDNERLRAMGRASCAALRAPPACGGPFPHPRDPNQRR
ncbi:MAG: Crp/Fnr family transcriptional regulator [Steroidobacteraceae bacterium]